MPYPGPWSFREYVNISLCAQFSKGASCKYLGRSFKLAVLDCVLEKFKEGFEGFSEKYRIRLYPEKLRTLCELEWPTFGVGRPPEGTLDLPTVKAVYQVVTGTPRYPDQWPYIDTWLQTATMVLLWVRFGANRQEQNKKFMAQSAKQKDKNVSGKSIHRGGLKEETIFQQPYIPVAPSVPTRPLYYPLPDKLLPSVPLLPLPALETRSGALSSTRFKFNSLDLSTWYVGPLSRKEVQT